MRKKETALRLPSFLLWRGRRSPGALPEGWSSSAICHSGYTGQYLAVDPVRRAAAIVLTNLKSDDPAVRSASFEGRRRVAALFG